MISSITAQKAGASAPVNETEKLRAAGRQLEGLFVRQLFAAMRTTVPTEGGIVSGGAGEELFTGLLDESLADATPTQWNRGLSDRISAQLAARLHPAPAPDK